MNFDSEIILYLDNINLDSFDPENINPILKEMSGYDEYVEIEFLSSIKCVIYKKFRIYGAIFMDEIFNEKDSLDHLLPWLLKKIEMKILEKFDYIQNNIRNKF